MPVWLTLLAAVLGLYALAVLWLIIAGRRTDARALAGFVPDCAVLFARLARDPCVPRRRAWLIGAMVGYLAMPFDLVPDFLPVVGQLDDAILVALCLRIAARGCGRGDFERHWPGPPSSLKVVLRLAMIGPAT
jgi:uncharacterized membrane protein YkvA (DUF1232 family)